MILKHLFKKISLKKFFHSKIILYVRVRKQRDKPTAGPFGHQESIESMAAVPPIEAFRETLSQGLGSSFCLHFTSIAFDFPFIS